MAGQICKTYKHKNDWCCCSPNSCRTDYEYDRSNDFVEYVKNEFDCDITIKKDKKPDTFESIFGESFSDSVENSMIRASRKAGLTRNELLDTLFEEEGLIGVYNLGMKHMYEYLEEKKKSGRRGKLYIDLDNVVFNTTKCIVDLYDEDFRFYSDYKQIHWSEITSWNFNELSAAKTEQINSYFNQSRFFNNVEFIDDAYSIIAKLAISYDIYFVSHGYSPNLRLKEKFIKQKFPFAKFIGVNLKEYKDKSCVDMSGGIFIDDAINNLEGSNADFKICFGNYSWNGDWDGIRCVSWNEVKSIIDKLNINNYQVDIVPEFID